MPFIAIQAVYMSSILHSNFKFNATANTSDGFFSHVWTLSKRSKVSKNNLAHPCILLIHSLVIIMKGMAFPSLQKSNGRELVEKPVANLCMCTVS